MTAVILTEWAREDDRHRNASSASRGGQGCSNDVELFGGKGCEQTNLAKQNCAQIGRFPDHVKPP